VIGEKFLDLRGLGVPKSPFDRGEKEGEEIALFEEKRKEAKRPFGPEGDPAAADKKKSCF